MNGTTTDGSAEACGACGMQSGSEEERELMRYAPFAVAVVSAASD